MPALPQQMSGSASGTISMPGIECSMSRARAAAALSGRRDDVAAFGREHVDGCRVDVREHEALDAAGEQTGGHAPLAERARASRHARGEAFPGYTRSEHQGRAEAREE